MTVDSITPWTPTPTQTPTPITVQLTIESNIDRKGVRIIGERGNPIQSQTALDTALANQSPPASAGLPIPAHPEVMVDLSANMPATVTFSTTTSLQDDGQGICLCHASAVYPLFFSAHQVGEGGVDQRLGVVATYLPVFDGSPKPTPARVSWLWPLLDRPHRSTSETVFTDDDLSTEIGTDGRLTRALQVVAEVGATIPVTVIVDPELLDEIWTMANTAYQVRDGTSLVAGTGKDAAAAWLDQLRNLLTSDPSVQIELTPFADPNVEAVTAANLTWLNALPTTAMASDVSDALAGRALDSTIAWPASGAISSNTLATLAKNGVSTVVLNSAAVTPKPVKGAVPPGLARLQAGGADIAAVLTSPTLQRYAARAVTTTQDVSAALPALLAELAVRMAQEPDVEHAVVLAAPRYVDPDVAAAVQAIRETSTATFTRPIALRAAVSGELLPTGRSGLARVPTSADDLGIPTFSAAIDAATKLPAIRSMLDTKHDVAARAFVQSLPIGIQRAESSAWRDPAQSSAASTYATELSSTVDGITTGVRIVSPSSGAYTLASNSSPLPITVDNELPYAVNVLLRIDTIPAGLLGFSTSRIGVQHVDSKQRRTLKIPTTIERSGRIRIEALLYAPNGVQELGRQELTVRSAALGTIGVIITIAAGVVLALALLVRFARRLRDRKATGNAPLPPVQVEEPEPA
jgi:hypothetical protein